jgi:hypothetical protein
MQNAQPKTTNAKCPKLKAKGHKAITLLSGVPPKNPPRALGRYSSSSKTIVLYLRNEMTDARRRTVSHKAPAEIANQTPRRPEAMRGDVERSTFDV